jgi:hypothetical protein
MEEINRQIDEMIDVPFTEEEKEFITNYIQNEPLTNQVCLGYWTHLRNLCWSSLNQHDPNSAADRRLTLFKQLGFNPNTVNQYSQHYNGDMLDFVVGFSFSNDLPILIKRYINTLLKSYEYPNENPQNPLELSFCVIKKLPHLPGDPTATIGGTMSNIWKSFIMTEKHKTCSDKHYFVMNGFYRLKIPPMFEATTAMQILLERKKKPVYLEDIFPTTH